VVPSDRATRGDVFLVALDPTLGREIRKPHPVEHHTRPRPSHRLETHMSHSIATIPPSDFDFIIGDWHVRHRRLNARLTGCADWTEFVGTSSTRKILRGFGNVEDNILHLPEGQIHASACRSFDVRSKQWAIWWLDGRAPHHLDVPVVGSFSGSLGTFVGNDTLDGKPITVRFTWHAAPSRPPVWEQAFSGDDGTTWETIWVMAFRRRQCLAPRSRRAPTAGLQPRLITSAELLLIRTGTPPAHAWPELHSMQQVRGGATRRCVLPRRHARPRA